MRKLPTTLAIVSLLSPTGGAQALGVGEIKLQSALNQAFRAEIPLVLSRESLGDLRVTLAPPGEFVKAGIDRPHVLTRLHFEPVRKPDGSYAIRIASNEPIHEPFMSFLLEMSWPEGRMLRSFTVLLDPPDSAVSPAYASARRRDEGLAPAATTYSRGIDPSVYRPAEPSSEYDGATYGPVRRREKLWRIAEKVKPDTSISSEQMVMALFRYNPQAFSQPNVNALTTGAILRVPDVDYIRSLSPAVAREEFFQHEAQYSGRAARSAAVAQSLPTPSSDLSPASAEGPPAVPGMGAANGAPDSGKLAARAFESLKRETDAMVLRLGELEKRIVDLQARLDEKGALLNQLQASLESRKSVDRPATAITGQIPAAAAPTVPDAAPSGSLADRPQNALPPASELAGSVTKPAASLTSATGSETAPSPAPTRDQPAVTPIADRPAPVAIPKPTPLPVIQSNEADDEVDGFGIVGAFATAFAVALGGLLFWRRKLAQSVRVEDEVAKERASTEPRSWEQGTNATAAMTDEFDESEQTSDIADGISEEPLLPAGRESRADQDDVDPIFESDVYLAYGRYKQAEEAMRSAISEHPDREAYRLKLLEVFVASQNKDEFEEYAARLSERGAAKDQEFWQKVRDMGQKLCPDSPLFTEQAALNTPPVIEPEDETDRLIEDLRSFSLDIPTTSPGNEAPVLDADVVLPSLKPDEIPALEEEPELSRAIDWTTIDIDEPSGGVAVTANVPDMPAASVAEEDPDERVIEFEPVAEPSLQSDVPVVAEQTEGQQSIDEILKELSAIHYRRHQDTDPGEGADQAAVDTDVADGVPAVTTDMDHAGPSLSPVHTELDVAFPEIDDLETRLDLARAYADLEDYPQAIALLEDVLRNGTDRQKAEATELMGRFSSV